MIVQLVSCAVFVCLFFVLIENIYEVNSQYSNKEAVNINMVVVLRTFLSKHEMF